MIGQATQTIFTRVYVLFLMTIYFWFFTLLGLVVFGIGPALHVVTELFMENQWASQRYRFKSSWQLFKQDFWHVNRNAWVFIGVILILMYNLYLSTQLNYAWMVMVQFLIIFGITLTFCVGIFTLLLRARYEVSMYNAVKLAFAQFFSSFYQLLFFITATIAIVLAAKKWPGLILFFLPGTYVVLADWLSRGWYQKIDRQLKVA
ncbi:YesL family protein [Latilactobacillus graminis]|uniref:Integral membrane protein n=2 Tax=Latilactobacillus graminis TaxID=60519 RepID=A0AA89I996_9LACO|nr:DUF624 domain-containing protein [Latilactobacillus graminis]KRM24191.1 integral membrane protein [Latilactobacillus graminis DSM 20719]QFP78826.1 DUF624 domain-containing protein [Latilactobacillus graminis]